MSTLTPKQRAFAANKAHGMKNREAAVAAGYSSTAASVTASQLLARADIKAAIKAAKKNEGANSAKDEDTSDSKYAMPKSKYDDSMEFLKDAMNHKLLPIAVRGDYAKALLPYQHARIGEKGKKESATDRAHKIAGTKQPGRSKFGPKKPPPLRVVGGNG